MRPGEILRGGKRNVIVKAVKVVVSAVRRDDVRRNYGAAGERHWNTESGAARLHITSGGRLSIAQNGVPV